jgi:hypothetical protein
MNSFGHLASNQILGGLIAATLYAATYLSFIRLLRFPRNWLLPSQKEILITGLLGLLTVGWVTLSSTGPDLLRLVIASSFLFTIAVTAQHVWMLWWQATGIHPRRISAIN